MRTKCSFGFWIEAFIWDLEVEEQNVVWTLSLQNGEQKFRHAWVLLRPFRFIYAQAALLKVLGSFIHFHQKTKKEYYFLDYALADED